MPKLKVWGLIVILLETFSNKVHGNCYYDARQVQNRIYGGSLTFPGEFPWMAMIVYSARNESHCGASLISSRFLLSAAHCVTGQILKLYGKLNYVRLGVQNTIENSGLEAQVGISRGIPHEQYNELATNRAFDIALIELNRLIDFTDRIQPICLPLPDPLPLGTNLTVAGWGKTPYASFSANKLKTVMRIVDNEICTKVYKKSKLQLLDSQICMGGYGNTDTCRGDSGNGMFYRDFLGIYRVYAIVSFGSSACGNEKFPSISTRVASFANWIKTNLNQATVKSPMLPGQ